jgi:hypothetical protein
MMTLDAGLLASLLCRVPEQVAQTPTPDDDDDDDDDEDKDRGGSGGGDIDPDDDEGWSDEDDDDDEDETLWTTGAGQASKCLKNRPANQRSRPPKRA